MLKFKDAKERNKFIAVVSLTVAVLLFEIFPRTGAVLSKTLDLITSNYSADYEQSLDAKYNTLLTENQFIKSKLNSLVSEYNDKQKASGIYNELNIAAEKSNVSITGIMAGEAKKKNGLWSTIVELELAGRYEGVYNMIRFIESSAKTMKIVSVNMRMKDGRLISSIKLSVYLNL